MDMFHPDDVETSVEAEVSKKKKAIDSLHSFLRVWARPRHCANPALQLKLSLKKMVKGTICPLQNLGKKLAVKTQLSVGFWTSKFACLWKAQ